MGFFGKIKDNLTGGGVKVELKAPMFFAYDDQNIPMEVTLSSTESRTVNKLVYKLYKDAKDNDHKDPNDFIRPLAQRTIDGPFQISPSAPVVLHHELFLKVPEDSTGSIQGPNGEQIPQQAQEMLGALTNRFSEVSNLSIDESKYDIMLNVFAEVDGIMVNPSARQKMKLSKPGEVGTGMNISL